MKCIIGIILLFSISACGQQNEKNEIQKNLNEIIEYAKENSLYRDKVDWRNLTKEMKVISKDAKSITDLSDALKHMLKTLGDEHGQIYYNNQILSNYFGEVKEHQKEMKSEIYNEIQFGQKYKFRTQELVNEIGYVRLVKVPMGDDQVLTEEIQNEVCKLVDKGIQNWIIDLRYNGGGNLLPMIEGLSVILGDGKIGGAKGITEEENFIWKIANGDFYMNDYSINVKNECELLNPPRIAVLVSSYTASSGEALAICFKGKEQTKFFGNKTFGQVTGNRYQMINDSIAVNLAVNYYQDRNENIYKEYVDIDEYVEFTEEPLSENDLAIKKAANWIREKKN